jgi:hypothetical protein
LTINFTQAIRGHAVDVPVVSGAGAVLFVLVLVRRRLAGLRDHHGHGLADMTDGVAPEREAWRLGHGVAVPRAN